MRLVQRREYVNSGHEQAMLRDWVCPALRVTISQYVGRRWGVRPLGKRLAIDLGRYSLLFWGIA